MFILKKIFQKNKNDLLKKILLDQNILSLSQCFSLVERKEKIKFGKGFTEFDIRGFKPKVQKNRRKQEIRRLLLLTLWELEISGKLKFFTGGELEFESFKSNFPFMAPGKIPQLEYVYPPVERSYWQQADISKFAEGGMINDFVELLIQTKFEKLFQIFPKSFHPKAEESFEKFCLVASHVKPHMSDAFHLWTAEVNDLDFFLTTDDRFLNIYNQSPIKFTSQPVTPRQLIKIFKIKKLIRPNKYDPEFNEFSFD